MNTLFIKRVVFDTIEFKGDFTVKWSMSSNIKVEYSDNIATIHAPHKAALCRAISLTAKRVDCGDKNFTFSSPVNFDMCGGMLDMSRNGVMKVEAIKKFIAYNASMGNNMLMLYTEDTYEIPEYRYFGYMRGRYTENELKEIDSYGQMLGVEIIPCIQTLGHLEQYLKWGEAAALKDTEGILLCGAEDTYKFIDAAIKQLRKCFTSKRIHIGMDESEQVGRGRYLELNGLQDRFEILNKHLEEVCKICKIHDFSPMMWSDMYFKINSDIHEYYDLNCVIKDDQSKLIPDVSMVFWDYYHSDKNVYDIMIKNHLLMGKEVIFAGGIWTWPGVLANLEYTFETMRPALQSCIEHGIKSAFATMWSDDGCETNHFYALPGLALFAEFCYSENEPTDLQVSDLLGWVCKMDLKDFTCMSSHYLTKSFFYTDILINQTGLCDPAYEQNFIIKANQAYNDGDGKWADYYSFVTMFYEIISIKANIALNLRAQYLCKDTVYLEKLANISLEDLAQRYETCMLLHQKMWLSTYKPFGWEVINSRYATLVARCKYASMRINDFINGTIDTIEELDEQPICEGLTAASYRRMITATGIF